jgi:hypothetical protein
VSNETPISRAMKTVSGPAQARALRPTTGPWVHRWTQCSTKQRPKAEATTLALESGEARSPLREASAR